MRKVIPKGLKETGICLNYTANLKTASLQRKMSLKTALKTKSQRNAYHINC